MQPARYEERPHGVYCARRDRVITRRDSTAWADYQAWLAAGNQPTAMATPPVRDLAAENRLANIRNRIVKLEAGQARALRELAIGNAAQKAAALERLRQIEMDIEAARVQMSAQADKANKPKKEI